MQIPVVKLLPTTVTVELDENDIAEFRRIVNDHFLSYVEFADFSGTYLVPKDRAIAEFADRFGVEGLDKAHRVAFYRSLLAYLK